MTKNKICVICLVFICSFILVSCNSDDTYKLAKLINNYKLNGTGYDDVLKMAKKGNYDANCEDCFKSTLWRTVIWNI